MCRGRAVRWRALAIIGFALREPSANCWGTPPSVFRKDIVSTARDHAHPRRGAASLPLRPGPHRPGRGRVGEDAGVFAGPAAADRHRRGAVGERGGEGGKQWMRGIRLARPGSSAAPSSTRCSALDTTDSPEGPQVESDSERAPSGLKPLGRRGLRVVGHPVRPARADVDGRPGLRPVVGATGFLVRRGPVVPATTRRWRWAPR